MANCTKFTPKKREAFLQYLRMSGNVSYSASMCGIKRRTAYLHREADKEFKKEWDDAYNAGIDALEQEARRRAFSGTKRSTVRYAKDGSKSVTTWTEYSDNLLMFLLKGARPEKYREAPVKFNIDLTKLSDEQLERIAAGEHPATVISNAGTGGDGEAPPASSYIS
jgi:hypothetical protein